MRAHTSDRLRGDLDGLFALFGADSRQHHLRGQPRTRLTKAPVGSIVPHQFIDRFGRRVYETYVIEPDRSLRLVSRRYRDLPLFDDD